MVKGSEGREGGGATKAPMIQVSHAGVQLLYLSGNVKSVRLSHFTASSLN